MMAKTPILITVDTEFSTHLEGIGVFGRIGEREYGLTLFQELLRPYQFKATFFVDVYTNRSVHIPALIEACWKLKEEGHELQLHTHPWVNGCERRMQDLSTGEQRQVLEWGRDTFHEWFQERPIAHRAGDWGANKTTLQVLADLGFLIDSSHFYGWKGCTLGQNSLTMNAPVFYQGIWEVPASVFECWDCGVFSRYRLLSTDGNSLEETWKRLKDLQGAGVPVINMVYHSFSFLRVSRDRKRYSVDQNRIDKFKELLERIARDESLEVMTVSKLTTQLKLGAEDALPNSGFLETFPRLLDRWKSRPL